MATHDGPFGLFWDTTRLEGAPLFHKAATYEIEWPYRISMSTIIRVTKSLGLVIGRWTKCMQDDEDAVLMKMLNGRELTENESWEYFSSTPNMPS